MAKIKKGKVSDLIQDDKNANNGTEIGRRMIAESVRTFGLGRSVLVDKDNRLIAGNKAQEATLENGIEKTIVVETDGSELIVVKRTDISLDDDRGRGLALADNRTAEHYRKKGLSFITVTSNPALIHYMKNSPFWACTFKGRQTPQKGALQWMNKTNSTNRITTSWKYIGKEFRVK